MYVAVICPGVYKIPHSPPPFGEGGGEFIKSFGEECKVVKRGREFKGFSLLGRISRGKKGKGSNIICSIILRL